jgi:Sodium/hydrogen exchanger family
VLGTLVFLAVSFTIGRRLVFQLIRWANDHLTSSAAVITVILLLMCGMAMTTHLIGVHTVLGAFVAGVLVGESPILTKQIDERLRGLITSLFMPVFFGLAGLSADLTLLKDPNLLLLTGALRCRRQHDAARQRGTRGSDPAGDQKQRRRSGCDGRGPDKGRFAEFRQRRRGGSQEIKSVGVAGIERRDQAERISGELILAFKPAAMPQLPSLARPPPRAVWRGVPAGARGRVRPSENAR